MFTPSLFLHPWLGMVSFVFQSVILIGLVILYFFEKLNRRWIWCGILFLVGGTLFFNSFLTYGQYSVWSHNELTNLLLNQPVDESLTPWGNLYNALGHFFGKEAGYFAYYSFSRFWFGSVVSLLTACITGVVFWLLHKVQLVRFDGNERLLLFFVALLTGWPQCFVFFVLFIAVSLLFIVYDNLFKKETMSSVVFPALAAAALSLVFSKYILTYLHLTGWYIGRY